MQIFRSFEDIAAGHELRAAQTVVTVGSFDGLHRGHQRVLEELVQWAKAIKARSLVMTFHTHPRTSMTGVPMRRITGVEHKLDLIAECGVDCALLVDFDERLKATSARDFCEQYLRGMLGCRGLLTGHNNRLGRNREGTPEKLAGFGQELGFEVRIALPMLENGSPISSSAIRKSIESGDLDTASRMLGRPYAVRGRVLTGRKLGRTIGTPTINLSLEGMVHPPLGVYGVRVVLEGKRYQGAANVGIRPTVEAEQTTPLLEVHLFDYSGECYGKDADVEFVFPVRGEQRFADIQSLREQIQKDIQNIKERFHGQ